MLLKLYITGLTQEEQYVLLKKIELIKHHVYPELEVNSSVLKHSPNWIRINQEINDMDKCLELFKCLEALDFKHEPDEYYEIYEHVHMTLAIEYSHEWDKYG